MGILSIIKHGESLYFICINISSAFLSSLKISTHYVQIKTVCLLASSFICASISRFAGWHAELPELSFEFTPPNAISHPKSSNNSSEHPPKVFVVVAQNLILHTVKFSAVALKRNLIAEPLSGFNTSCSTSVNSSLVSFFLFLCLLVQFSFFGAICVTDILGRVGCCQGLVSGVSSFAKSAPGRQTTSSGDIWSGRSLLSVFSPFVKWM